MNSKELALNEPTLVLRGGSSPREVSLVVKKDGLEMELGDICNSITVYVLPDELNTVHIEMPLSGAEIETVLSDDTFSYEQLLLLTEALETVCRKKFCPLFNVFPEYAKPETMNEKPGDYLTAYDRFRFIVEQVMASEGVNTPEELARRGWVRTTLIVAGLPEYGLMHAKAYGGAA